MRFVSVREAEGLLCHRQASRSGPSVEEHKFDDTKNSWQNKFDSIQLYNVRSAQASYHPVLQEYKMLRDWVGGLVTTHWEELREAKHMMITREGLKGY